MSAKKLKIDLTELRPVLEGFGGPELMHYLDTETGEIIALHDDFPDAEEIRARIDEGFGERYEVIKPLTPRESFDIMEEFVATLPESRGRAQFSEALSRNKPFRRFKDIVHSDIILRDAWFAFRDAALDAHARNWLRALDIEVVRQEE